MTAESLIQKFADYLRNKMQRGESGVSRDMIARELRGIICQYQAAQDDVVERCPVCDYPMAQYQSEGCVKNNCSYRPDYGTPEYYRIQDRKLAIAAMNMGGDQTGRRPHEAAFPANTSGIPYNNERLVKIAQFIHDRMIHVHGENENVDYLHAMRDVIEFLSTREPVDRMKEFEKWWATLSAREVRHKDIWKLCFRAYKLGMLAPRREVEHPVDSSLPERDLTKPAEQQGVFRKFYVRRTDGSSDPGGKHYGCKYFVLDVEHDRYAKAALAAYSRSCKDTHPELSKDIVMRYGLRESEREVEQPIEIILDEEMEAQDNNPVDDAYAKGYAEGFKACAIKRESVNQIEDQS